MPSDKALDHAYQGEVYRMMGIQGQSQDPKEPFRQALREFDLAIAENNENAWAYAHRGATHFQLALLEQGADFAGSYDKALCDFDKAIILNAQYSWAYAQKGETHRWLGIKHCSTEKSPNEFKLAMIAFNKAVELAPDYAWAYAHRAATRRYLFQPGGGLSPQDLRASLEDLNKAIALNSGYAWAYAYRSVFERLEANFEEAYASLEEAARLYPEVFYDYIIPEAPEHPRVKKGYRFFSAEQVSQAQQQLAHTPSDPFALYITTLAKFSQGGFAAIKEELRKGREMKIF